MKKLFLLISVVGLLALTGCATTTTPPIQNVPTPSIPSQPAPSQPIPPQHTACTMEAKLCPDGSAVGRSGPNCEFASCPGENPTTCTPTCSCPQGYRQEGEACNPECYYSTPKCLMPSRQCQPTNNCVQNK